MVLISSLSASCVHCGQLLHGPFLSYCAEKKNKIVLLANQRKNAVEYWLVRGIWIKRFEATLCSWARGLINSYSFSLRVKWVLAIQMVSLHGSVNKMLGGRLRWNNIPSGGGGGETSIQKGRGDGARRKFREEPLRGTVILFGRRGLKMLSPLSSTNSKTTFYLLSCHILFGSVP